MSIPHIARRIVVAAAITALAATGLAVTPAAAATGCRSLAIPVTAGLAGPATVHAVLCTPAAPSGQLQMLVSGGTYNSHYWDGEGVAAYSYEAAANAAGVTTLAIDPVGTGGSTHPLGALLTNAGQIQAAHQVIQAARAGSLDGVHYSDVVAVGHSQGSLMMVGEVAQHPGDVSGLVLTGYTHLVSATDLTDILLSSVRPADLTGFPALDPTYVTTVPGTREADFDAADDVDPAVVAGDEANRDVDTAVQLAGAIATGLLPTTSLGVMVPVLEVDGGQDAVFCGLTTPGCPTSADLYAHEAPDFSHGLAAFVAPRAGHDVTLAADTAGTDVAIQAWTAAEHAGAAPIGLLG